MITLLTFLASAWMLVKFIEECSASCKCDEEHEYLSGVSNSRRHHYEYDKHRERLLGD